jgi:hypothetical protein
VHNSLAVGFLCLIFVQSAQCEDGIPLHGKSVIRFASQKEAATLLGKRDRFIAAMSDFDRHSRLRDESADEAAVLELASSSAIPWSDQDIEKLTKVTASVHKRLSKFKIPFPKTVILIQTNGKEEGGAAYCRGNAVILPQRRVANDTVDRMEQLLIHELFHVLSNQNPKLRTSLYKIVGFHTCDPIQLPKSLTDRKITNPDAPLFDCYIDLTHNGEKIKATPVLYASVKKYDAKKGGSFFKYLTFRLMQVEEADGKIRAQTVDGEPIMLDPQKIESYFKQIGRNTGYIIHPDEILADNFKFMVLNQPNLKTPRIVDELRKQLTASEN